MDDFDCEPEWYKRECMLIKETVDKMLKVYEQYLKGELTFDNTWRQIDRLITPLEYNDERNMLMSFCFEDEPLGMIVFCVKYSTLLPVCSAVLALTPEGLKDYYEINPKDADFWLEEFEETFGCDFPS